MRRVFFQWLAMAGLLLAFRAEATDVSAFGILKSALFIQTNNGAPFQSTTNAFVFDAFVYAVTNNVATNATVQPGTMPVLTLPPQPGNTNLLYAQHFNDSNDMETAFPTGAIFSLTSYSLSIYTRHDGQQTAALTFGSGFPGSYSATPQIGNFSAAQSVDTTTAFTVSWSVADGKMNDLVQVSVMDALSNTVFASPGPGVSNALNGFSNSFAIPANALPPGTNLIAHVSVGRPVDLNTNAYVGATGVALLGKDVQFPMVTRPAPASVHLSVSNHTLPFHLQFNAETNRNYHLQAATSFTNWTNLLATNLSVAGNVLFTDTNSTNLSKRFYRVQIGP